MLIERKKIPIISNTKAVYGSVKVGMPIQSIKNGGALYKSLFPV